MNNEAKVVEPSLEVKISNTAGKIAICLEEQLCPETAAAVSVWIEELIRLVVRQEVRAAINKTGGTVQRWTQETDGIEQTICTTIQDTLQCLHQDLDK